MAEASAPAALPAEVCEAIAIGRLSDPFRWLGMHATPEGLRVAAFDPGAAQA